MPISIFNRPLHGTAIIGRIIYLSPKKYIILCILPRKERTSMELIQDELPNSGRIYLVITASRIVTT